MNRKDLLSSLGFGIVAGIVAFGALSDVSVAAFFAVLAAFAMAWPLWLFRRLQVQQVVASKRADINAYHLAQIAVKLGAEAQPLPELGGIRVSPDFAGLLLEEIFTRRPRVIAEFGCGASTILAASALRRIGAGKVFSFDHEAEFATATQSELVRRGLTEWAEVRHAPLVPSRAEPSILTYAEAAWAGVEGIELAVVDGPPGWIKGARRGVIVDALAAKLTPGARVLFDDGMRSEIKDSLNSWTQRHPQWTAGWINLEKGAWTLDAPKK